MSTLNNYLLLIWKDPNTRRNFTIGKLTYQDKFYFEYSEEASLAEQYGWKPLDAFSEKRQYESDVLFPVFSSRLPDRKRRDVHKILEKYNLKEFDEFELLRKSGARLPIDTYEFIDPIFPNDESIQKVFFIMGIRHHAPCQGTNCNLLPSVALGDKLILKHEPSNQYDPYAIQVLTKQGELLGYIPRYYTQSILYRIQHGDTYSCQILEVIANCNCSECIKVKLDIPETIYQEQ